MEKKICAFECTPAPTELLSARSDIRAERVILVVANQVHDPSYETSSLGSRNSGLHPFPALSLLRHCAGESSIRDDTRLTSTLYRYLPVRNAPSDRCLTRLLTTGRCQQYLRLATTFGISPFCGKRGAASVTMAQVEGNRSNVNVPAQEDSFIFIRAPPS